MVNYISGAWCEKACKFSALRISLNIPPAAYKGQPEWISTTTPQQKTTHSKPSHNHSTRRRGGWWVMTMTHDRGGVREGPWTWNICCTHVIWSQITYKLHNIHIQYILHWSLYLVYSVYLGYKLDVNHLAHLRNHGSFLYLPKASSESSGFRAEACGTLRVLEILYLIAKDCRLEWQGSFFAATRHHKVRRFFFDLYKGLHEIILTIVILLVTCADFLMTHYRNTMKHQSPTIPWDGM